MVLTTNLRQGYGRQAAAADESTARSSIDDKKDSGSLQGAFATRQSRIFSFSTGLLYRFQRFAMTAGKSFNRACVFAVISVV